MGLLDNATGMAKENLGLVALGAGVAGVGAGIGVASLIGGKTKKKTRKSRNRRKITHTSRGWKQDRKRKSKQKWEVAYRRHKKKHKKGSKRMGKVYYARKTGQPYIILSSGKAKFIKGKRRYK